MAKFLIVHAHPEPRSFCSALSRCAENTLREAGHSVEVSDLYALGFDPVSSRKNFTTVADPQFFKPQAEERHATQLGGFSPMLEAEMRKLEACDVLLFSFPLWWFGMPAILKGWVDRVFAMGRTYGNGRLYENGIGRGKRALVLMTTGSKASAFRQHGVHASLENLLAPIHRGVFAFNGYAPLRPFVTWGAAHISQEQRDAELQRLRERMSGLLLEPAATQLRLSECSEDTWEDLCPRFLVSVRGLASEEGTPVLSESDLAQLRQLKLEGKLLRALLPASGVGTWHAALELRAMTVGEAEGMLSELPFARTAECAYTRLDSKIENDLSPFWAG